MNDLSIKQGVKLKNITLTMYNVHGLYLILIKSNHLPHAMALFHWNDIHFSLHQERICYKMLSQIKGRKQR